MGIFTTINVRQPVSNDIVDNPIRICGVGTGFEGTVIARVRDNNGTTIEQQSFQAGGTGIVSNFCTEFSLGQTPATVQGTLEVFASSGRGGEEPNKVVVPIVFGNALVDNYFGHYLYAVEPGDTLSKLAERFYENGELYTRIYRANLDRLNDPDRINVGQVLRIPASFG